MLLWRSYVKCGISVTQNVPVIHEHNLRESSRMHYGDIIVFLPKHLLKKVFDSKSRYWIEQYVNEVPSVKDIDVVEDKLIVKLEHGRRYVFKHLIIVHVLQHLQIMSA